jgi:hypothetical protein
MKAVNRLKAVAAGALAVLGLSVGNANAIFLFPGAQLEDDNLEYILDKNGQLKTTGALEVGDRLRAVIEIVKITGGGQPTQQLDTGPVELTGLSEIEVDAIVPLGAGFVQVHFKPSTQFAAEIASLAGGNAGDYAGAMVALWTDATPDFDTSFPNAGCNDRMSCVASATNGSLWAVAGFGGDADNAWHTSLFQNPGTLIQSIAVAEPTVSALTYNYNLDVLVNNTGYTFGLVNGAAACNLSLIPTCFGDQSAQIVGSGSVLGGKDLADGFIGRSDFDFGVNATRIPEPASLALVAGCVLGAGAIARRRTKA